MAPEDHRATQILVEDVAVVLQLEVLRQQGRGHVVGDPERVDGVTRLVQGLFVDIGGVDLDPFAKGLEPERFGQQNAME